MKHLFILNPAAGRTDQTADFTAAIEAAFAGRDEPFEIAVSKCPGDCAALARAACETGEELRLYACGGDGTLNEVVNGAAGFPNAAVTHYPGGSGNDFIKVFSDPAAFRELERLLDADEARFDLIQVGEDHYGLNICSIGIDARVGTEMARYKRLPLMSGHGAYILSTIVNTVKGVHRPYVIELDDGTRLDGRQSLICVANGRWYGSGFHPVPDAEPDSGFLDVLVVKAVSRLTVARVIGIYKKGGYRQLPELVAHYRCRSLRVRCGRPEPVNLDGELLVSSDVLFRVAGHKIRFFFPRGLTWRSAEKEKESISV